MTPKTTKLVCPNEIKSFQNVKYFKA